MHDPPGYKLTTAVVNARSTLWEDGGEHMQSSEVRVEIVHVAHHLKTEVDLQGTWQN